MPATPYTVYVYLRNGRIAEVANVTAYAIISPVIQDGTYRDTPPVVGAAASIAGSLVTSYALEPIVTSIGPATIAGGVTPTLSDDTGISKVSVSSPSSILQDDRYTHNVPRFAYHPECLLVFTTSNAGTLTYPTATQGTTSYSASTSTGSYDSVFRWKDVKGWTNTAPQGWASND